MVLKMPTRVPPPRSSNWMLVVDSGESSRRVLYTQSCPRTGSSTSVSVLLPNTGLNHCSLSLVSFADPQSYPHAHRHVCPDGTHTHACTHTHTHTPLLPLPIAVPISLNTTCLLETASTSKDDTAPWCQTQITTVGTPGFPTSALVQFSSVAHLCPTLCHPVNRSIPVLPVHHQLLEVTQTHEQVFI